MPSFMKALRSLFKRGSKKTKQEKDRPISRPAQPAPLKTQTSSGPPVLPPLVTNKDSLQPNTDTPTSAKAIPPSHPLATGRHRDTREAVSQHQDMRAGALVDNRSDLNPQQKAQEVEREEHDVSPAALTPGDDGRRSDVVSAMEPEGAPEAPAPTNGIRESPGLDEMERPAAAGGTVPHHTTFTAQRLDPATAPLHGLQTNGIAPEEESIVEGHTVPPHRSTHTPVEPPRPLTGRSDEEKIVVNSEEPPPIKAINAAPGMSATSGPLEDFPDGNFHV